ncbi:MAG: proton-conducting transporter membrane subunit, partial [Thermodesulfovibrio sp.]|nr:proton-conducting transporter membrane subunit [Thermodesulfovibrio sp.]
GKITLFFTAGAIYVATHKTNISELDGIGRQMPFTMASFIVGALSMIGIPPFAGFISKWYLSLGALEAGEFFVLGVLATSTILNACYFMPIVYTAFLREPKSNTNISRHDKGGIQEAPVLVVLPLVLTAIGTLFIFFYPSIFLEIIKVVISNVIEVY